MAEVNLLVEERRSGLDVLAIWLPRIALAIVFLNVGSQKFGADRMWVRIFDQIGVGQWFRYLTGTMQVGGAVLLLIPRTAAIGFVVVGCTMIGAVAFWILSGHPFGAIIPGALLVAIAIVGFRDVSGFLARLRHPTAR